MSNYVINLLSVVSLFLLDKLISWIMGSFIFASKAQGELTKTGFVFGIIFLVLIYTWIFTTIQETYKDIFSKIIK